MQHNTGAVTERQCNTTADCIASSGLIHSLEAYADMMARILCAAARNEPVRVRRFAHEGTGTHEAVSQWLRNTL